MTGRVDGPPPGDGAPRDTLGERVAQTAAREIGMGPVTSEPLSRYKQSVWRVTGADHAQAVVKVALRQVESTVDTVAWLGHEFRASTWAYRRNLVRRAPLGCGSCAVDGADAFWIAFRYFSGRSARSICTSAAQAQHVALRTCDVLRRLHAGSRDGFPLPPGGGGDRARTLESRLTRVGFPELDGRIAERLLADEPAMARGIAPCHGDVSFNNILVPAEADGVELIDWGLSRVAHPLVDLAPLFVWLSLWGHVDGAQRLSDLTVGACENPPPSGTFAAHLARAALARATWKGTAWADVASRVLPAPDPSAALRILFAVVAERGLRSEVGA